MDISKLHPDHRQIVKELIDDKFGIGYTEEHKQRLYNIYLELSKIPKKDWNKESTKEVLRVVDKK